MSTTQSPEEEKRAARAVPASIIMVERADVCRALNIHTATLDRWIARGEFPRPVFLTATSNVGKWPLSVLEAHIAKRTRGRRVRVKRGFQRRDRRARELGGEG